MEDESDDNGDLAYISFLKKVLEGLKNLKDTETGE